MSSGLALGFLAAAVATSPASVSELAPQTHFVAGEFIEGGQPDGNSVLFRAPDGWVIVDTGRHAAHTQTLLDFVDRSDLPLKAVINTHWHLDHIGGNVLVRERTRGVRIYASAALEDAMTGFLASYRAQLEDLIAGAAGGPEAQRPYRAELALLEAGPLLAPDEVVARSGSRSIAGRTLVVNLEQRAVTAGDLWVLDPETEIVVAGDLVTLPVPFFDTACPEGWQSALRHVAGAEFTLLVPGHGEPMNRQAFETYRHAFDALLACAESDAAAEQCIDGWIGNARSLIAEADDERVRSQLDYYMKTSLRGDPANSASLCGA